MKERTIEHYKYKSWEITNFWEDKVNDHGWPVDSPIMLLLSHEYRSWHLTVWSNTDDLINYLSVTDREASKALNKKIKENEEWLTSNA